MTDIATIAARRDAAARDDHTCDVCQRVAVVRELIPLYDDETGAPITGALAGRSPASFLGQIAISVLELDPEGLFEAPLTFASHTYEDFHLLMPLFACRRWQGTVRATEGQTLAWVKPNALKDYPMPPADLPLIPILRDWL